MLPTASATLITNLIASLADADHRWVVVSVSEDTWLDAVPPNYNAPNYAEISTGPLVLQPANVISPAAGGVTAVETTIKLVATKVRLSAGSQQMLELRCVSRWHNGAFSSGRLMFSDGSAYTHTNATLDTALRTMALALMTARTTPIEGTLSSGDASADPIAMPSTLLAALLASLDVVTHGWEVTATSFNTHAGVSNFTCSLAAGEALKSAVGSVVPASISYVAQLNALGTIIDAKVYSGVGGVWRTFDTDLYDAIKAMADAFQTAQAAALEAGLEAGPVP